MSDSTFAGEFFKTIRSYRSWFGWIAVGGALIWNLNAGYVTMEDIQTLVREAVNVIQAVVPGGVQP